MAVNYQHHKQHVYPNAPHQHLSRLVDHVWDSSKQRFDSVQFDHV